jgi:hypothetical protein
MRVPRCAVCAGSLALAAAATCLPAAQAASGPGTDISVMAFDVEQLPTSVPATTPGTDHRKERAALAEKLIRSKAPEVVALTEAFTSETQKVRSSLKGRYPYQTELVGQNCRGPEWDSYSGDCSNSPVVISGGFAILSKYPIKEKHQLIFDDSSKNSWDHWANKGAALVRLDVQGAPVWIAGTDLQADEKTPVEDAKVRLKQLAQLHTWAKAL